jgi:hypothetical protein
MKTDDVDKFIKSIFEVPDEAPDLAKEWLSITKIFAEVIARADDLLIIEAQSERYEDCHPYLQICYEDDGAMTIEAVSNRFLTPPLSLDAQNTMAELGWGLSDESSLPNYFIFLHKEEARVEVVAELFTRTLRLAYGIQIDDPIEISTAKGVWSNDDSDTLN